MALFFLFLALSFMDGVVIHLFRLRLQELPSSKWEHKLHTIRAFLFVPIVSMLFIWNVTGASLYALIALLLIDLFVESLDVLEERRSRAPIGGLKSGEYLLHILESTARVASIAIAIALKPLDAWRGELPVEFHDRLVVVGGVIAVSGGIALAILHTVLIVLPTLITRLFGARSHFLDSGARNVS